MKVGGHNFHPSRVKGSVKFGRALEANKKVGKKKTFESLDLKKQNWSLSK